MTKRDRAIMEGFAVDLDKVLDDFELSEGEQIIGVEWKELVA